LRNFILQTLPVWIAKKIEPNFERPEKGHPLAGLVRLLAFIFAVQYFIARPYMVPTGSMNHTIENNDFLLVNRFIYGIKSPDHIGIPMTNINFVREVPTIRLSPQLRDIKSNDIIVFRADHEEPIVEYVKRVVGAPGDRVRMHEGIIFVNDNKFQDAKSARLESYLVLADSINNVENVRLGALKRMVVADLNDFSIGILQTQNFPKQKSTEAIIQDLIDCSLTFTYLLKHDLENKKYYNFLYTNINNYRNARIQTTSQTYENALLDITKKYLSTRGFVDIQNLDNFSEILIPKKGDILDLDSTHIDIVSNVVYYDGHHMEIKDGRYFIDGEEKQEYIVEQDYYFMIGDNRHNSLDSRHWGLVPHKFVNGAPILIYFSVKKFSFDDLLYSLANLPGNIAWDRIGKILF
jgi:signal peptidase I